jgi:hypothetical protein
MMPDRETLFPTTGIRAIAVDLRTEPFIELNAALVPLCDIPLDHTATSLLGLFRDGFHQELANPLATASIGNI